MSGEARSVDGWTSRIVTVACLMMLGADLPVPARATVRAVPEAYPTIQAAIVAAVSGDSILLSPGVYRGPGNRDIQLWGKNVVVTSRTGAEETIIDCEQAGRGFYVHQWESHTARIEKLTIMNGVALSGWERMGGGIYCDIASPTIADCVIRDCRGELGGGVGLSLYGGTVERCRITGNIAENGGGIGTAFAGGITFRDCVVTGNRAEGGGGGGISLQGDGGGDIVRNCTVSANYAGYGGGGIYSCCGATIDRSIVWGNCAPMGSQLYASWDQTSLVCSTIDSAGVDVWHASIDYGNDCVFSYPLFCGPLPCGVSNGGDWSLDAASPCLPENSPCGALIGAVGQGCGVPPTPTGACCYSGGSCLLQESPACADHGGTYMGDQTVCTPNPCTPTPVEVSTWGRIKMRFR